MCHGVPPRSPDCTAVVGSLNEQKGVGVILADVNDADSLRRMCAQTTVVIDCVGPVRTRVRLISTVWISLHYMVVCLVSFLRRTSCVGVCGAENSLRRYHWRTGGEALYLLSFSY